MDQQDTALWLRLVERSAEGRRGRPAAHRAALRRAARAIPGMTNLTVTDGFTAARVALAKGRRRADLRPGDPRNQSLGSHLVAQRQSTGHRPDCPAAASPTPSGSTCSTRSATSCSTRGEPLSSIWRNSKTDSSGAEQEASEFAETTLLPGGGRSLIARAATREDLLLLAARLGIGVSIIAGQHGYLTDQWNVGASLRGTITDTDIDLLEEISRAGPREDKLAGEPGIAPG